MGTKTEMPVLRRAPVFTDTRGVFFAAPLEPDWVQSNVSISSKHTFRGLHHQKGSTSQKKIVTVVKGAILDIVVDLRKGRFKETHFFRMSPGDQLVVPKGFAHSFLALEDDTVIQYFVDYPYSQPTEISFHWRSVPLVEELVLAEVGDPSLLKLSEKDQNAVMLGEEHAE